MLITNLLGEAFASTDAQLLLWKPPSPPHPSLSLSKSKTIYPNSTTRNSMKQSDAYAYRVILSFY